MNFKPKHPPRSFKVGYGAEIILKDCGTMELTPDEQITFMAGEDAEYDVVRKAWGFYATPSLNSRLKKFGLRGALVKGLGDKYYICLVERGKGREFKAYLRLESQDLVCWLDDDKILRQLAGFMRSKLED